MAATPEGLTAGAVTTNTTRGLYTSQDSGQTWTYNALLDSGIVTAAAGKFFHRISGPLLHRFADDRSGFRTGLLTLPYKPEPDHCCRTKNRPVQPALAASGIFFQWCHQPDLLRIASLRQLSVQPAFASHAQQFLADPSSEDYHPRTSPSLSKFRATSRGGPRFPHWSSD